MRWPAWVGLAAAVCVAYSLAARLSLLLLTDDSVALFWPAAGLSAGFLIALGRSARWPVALGVFAATIIVHHATDVVSLVSFVFALSNAGETLLIAWLIERFVDGELSLDELRHVLWLVVAAVIGTATSGIGGTIGVWLFRTPTAPIGETWWHWFSSNAIGVITTAPLVIGIASLAREPPSRREIIEASAALLGVVAVMGTIIFLLPEAWWDRIAPVELLLPLLLWISARCRPACTSAAVFIVSLTIVASFIFRLGHFGDVGASMEQRVFATDAAILGVAIFSYILAALFAERRQHAAEIEASGNRTRAIVNTVVDGIIVIDDERTVESLNPAASRAFGYCPEEVIGRNIAMLMPELDNRKRQRWLADLVEIGQPRPVVIGSREITGVRKDGSIFPIEFAISEMSVAGRKMLTIVTRDITERKLSEEKQATLTNELQHRTNNLLTLVQLLASRTLSGDDPPKEKQIFEARLQALARANRQLTESDWSGLTLGEIVRSELEPYLTRCDIDGTDIALDRQCAQNFSLAMHELATNAVKYGALSNLEGRIHIGWDIKDNGADSQLSFHWRELGGPPVTAPKRQGFGSRLLRTIFSNSRSHFDASGFSWELDVPFQEVSPADGRDLTGPGDTAQEAKGAL